MVDIFTIDLTATQHLCFIPNQVQYQDNVCGPGLRNEVLRTERA